MSSDTFKSIGKKKHRCFNPKGRTMAKKSMRRRFIRLKEETESIEEERRRVREKMEAVKEECQRITKETNEIFRQTAITQIRLSLMFNILKARQDGDIDKASHFIQLLREIMERS